MSNCRNVSLEHLAMGIIFQEVVVLFYFGFGLKVKAAMGYGKKGFQLQLPTHLTLSFQKQIGLYWPKIALLGAFIIPSGNLHLVYLHHCCCFRECSVTYVVFSTWPRLVRFDLLKCRRNCLCLRDLSLSQNTFCSGQQHLSFSSLYNPPI